MTDTTSAPEPTVSAATHAAAPRPASNKAVVAKLLTRARGATIAELQEATGWQPHSARAHLSGLRKIGKTLLKEKRRTGETSYRLAPVKPASEAPE